MAEEKRFEYGETGNRFPYLQVNHPTDLQESLYVLRRMFPGDYGDIRTGLGAGDYIALTRESETAYVGKHISSGLSIVSALPETVAAFIGRRARDDD